MIREFVAWLINRSAEPPPPIKPKIVGRRYEPADRFTFDKDGTFVVGSDGTMQLILETVRLQNEDGRQRMLRFNIRFSGSKGKLVEELSAQRRLVGLKNYNLINIEPKQVNKLVAEYISYIEGVGYYSSDDLSKEVLTALQEFLDDTKIIGLNDDYSAIFGVDLVFPIEGIRVISAKINTLHCHGRGHDNIVVKDRFLTLRYHYSMNKIPNRPLKKRGGEEDEAEIK